MIKIPDLMLLNKDTDRKFELGGGFTTDPKYFVLIPFPAQGKGTKGALLRSLLLQRGPDPPSPPL